MSENLLTKRIKDWVKTALKAHFVQGNYIPMDGINGTQKIPAEFFNVLNNVTLITNAEYVYAAVDSNDTFLFGVKKDGSFVWSKGMSEDLRSRIKSISDAIISLEQDKVDKEGGKSLVNQTFADGVSFVSNNEYVLAVLDSYSKFLFGVKTDGSFQNPSTGKIFSCVSDMCGSPIVSSSVSTLGYYAPGDGGGATYKIVDTLPSGVRSDDAIKLYDGRYAIIQLDSGIFSPEQFGLIPGNPNDNASSYILRGFRMGGSVCKLGAHTYHLKSILLLPENATLEGVTPWGTNHTIISVEATFQGKPYGINVSNRKITIRNIAIDNGSGVTDEGSAIFTTGYDPSFNKYNLTLERLIIYNFSQGLWFAGEGKWVYSLKNIRIMQCGHGVYCDGGFCINFDQVYTDHCDVAFRLLNTSHITFTNCNIGITRKGIVLGSEGGGATHIGSTLCFQGCNFEYDEPIADNPGATLYLEDSAGCTVCFVSNRFYFNPSYVDSSSSHISMGAKSRIILIANSALGYTEGNFIDPYRVPALEIGSIQYIGSNIGIKEPTFDDERFSPCVLSSRTNFIPSVVDDQQFIVDFATLDKVLFFNNGSIKVKEGTSIKTLKYVEE